MWRCRFSAQPRGGRRVHLRKFPDLVKIRLFLSLFALSATAGFAAIEEAPKAGGSQIAPDQLDFFEKKIRPVLADKCYKCHGESATKIKGGLTLDTREG